MQLPKREREDEEHSNRNNSRKTTSTATPPEPPFPDFPKRSDASSKRRRNGTAGKSGRQQDGTMITRIQRVPAQFLRKRPAAHRLARRPRGTRSHHAHCVVSLGAPRTFQIRSKRHGGRDRASIKMQPGSLVLMENVCQHHYLHSVPREPEIQEGRINLTFRCKALGAQTEGERQHARRDHWLEELVDGAAPSAAGWAAAAAGTNGVRLWRQCRRYCYSGRHDNNDNHPLLGQDQSGSRRLRGGGTAGIAGGLPRLERRGATP